MDRSPTCSDHSWGIDRSPTFTFTYFHRSPTFTVHQLSPFTNFHYSRRNDRSLISSRCLSLAIRLHAPTLSFSFRLTGIFRTKTRLPTIPAITCTASIRRPWSGTGRSTRVRSRQNSTVLVSPRWDPRYTLSEVAMAVGLSTPRPYLSFPLPMMSEGRGRRCRENYKKKCHLSHSPPGV